MLSLYRVLSLRYLRRRWTWATLVVLSIALGVATWVVTSALNNSLEEAIRQAATPLAGVADLHVSNGDFGVPEKLAERLRKIAGVRAVQALVIEQVQVVIVRAGQPPDRTPAVLLGLDLQAASAGDRSSWGVDVQQDALEAYAAASFLRKNKLLRTLLPVSQPALVGRRLDESIKQDGRLSILLNSRLHPVGRVGTIDAHGPAATLGGYVIVMDHAAAAELAEHPGRVSRLDVFLESGVRREEVIGLIEQELARPTVEQWSEAVAALSIAPDTTFPARLPWSVLIQAGRKEQAKVRTAEAQDQRIHRVLAGLKVGFAMMGVGALVVGMFLVYNSLAVSVAERRHDIGILRSLGATRLQVGALFIGEAVILGAAGTLIGLPLGMGLASLLLGHMQGVLSDVFLPVHTQQTQIDPSSMMTAAVAGLVTVVLAALIPAVRAARAEPVDVVRRAPASRRLLHFLLLFCWSAVQIALGVTLIVLKNYLPARLGSHLGLLLILLSIFPIMPLLIALSAGSLQPVMRRLFPIQGRLAADNLLRTPGRTGFVIAALAAGVALMIMQAGFIRSSNHAFLFWLDQSVTADMMVTSGGPLSSSGQTLPMKETVLDELKEDFAGLRVVPITFKYVDWPGQQDEDLVLLALIDTRTYYEVNQARHRDAPKLEEFRRLSEEPGTAIVSENFALLHGVRVGDSMKLPAMNNSATLLVIGTIGDCSWHRGTVLVHRSEQNLRQFDARQVDVFDIYRPQGVDDETIRRHIQQSPWGAQNALFVMTRNELRKHVVGVINRLFGLAYSQEIVVALVANLGVVVAMLISVLRRRRELGMLRAVGATQAQVVHSVLAESVLMGGMVLCSGS